jgi:hypothetical protein
MYSIKATKKLLDRMRQPIDAPVGNPSTKLGNWFAKPLFWQPQYALFVSELTFLPVFAPLAPASELAMRFPDDLAETLRAHGVSEAFIEIELAAMDDFVVSKTDSRQVVGVLNEFAVMANRMRELHSDLSPLRLAMQLAEVPVGIHRSGHRFPGVALHALVESEARNSSNET